MARSRTTRRSAVAARESLQTPIPRFSDDEEDVQDVDIPDAPTTDPPTPQDEDGEEDDQPESETAASPSRLEREVQTPRRRGRGGRGRPRGRPRVHALKNEVSEDNDGSEDTPKRRGGFRGHRGGRWGNKRTGSTRPAQIPVDEEGNELEIEGDEVSLPTLPAGEAKVEPTGILKGDREYRVRTFPILGRDERLYMLSTEAARCVGFRDSYLLFTKHASLYKIIIGDEEKKDMIDRDLIPHSYKGRSIGVVTARSIFREFGAKIIVGGRKITDDYDEDAARERGDVEGDLAVPEDRLPTAGETYNRNQYVAWHGASAVYHTNLPSVPVQNGKPVEGKRKRITMTSNNWMLEHARDASRFNSALKAARDMNDMGVYDIHTNTMQWPKMSQPTHARWEVVNDDLTLHAEDADIPSSKFTKLHPVYARNFRIHDLCLESAPDSTLGNPGLISGGPSLMAIAPTILDELPPDCRAAFEEAAESELSWRGKWLNESIDGQRAVILPSVDWYPK